MEWEGPDAPGEPEAEAVEPAGLASEWVVAADEEGVADEAASAPTEPEAPEVAQVMPTEPEALIVVSSAPEAPEVTPGAPTEPDAPEVTPDAPTEPEALTLTPTGTSAPAPDAAPTEPEEALTVPSEGPEHAEPTERRAEESGREVEIQEGGGRALMLFSALLAVVLLCSLGAREWISVSSARPPTDDVFQGASRLSGWDLGSGGGPGGSSRADDEADRTRMRGRGDHGPGCEWLPDANGA